MCWMAGLPGKQKPPVILAQGWTALQICCSIRWSCFLMFPSLWNTLPVNIWYTVAAIAMIRISAYLIAAAKYRRFTALHTKLNKLTGMGAFLIPYLLATEYVVGFCWVVCAVAVIASLEELFIHLRSQICCSNTEKTMKTNQ